MDPLFFKMTEEGVAIFKSAAFRVFKLKVIKLKTKVKITPNTEEQISAIEEMAEKIIEATKVTKKTKQKKEPK